MHERVRADQRCADRGVVGGRSDEPHVTARRVDLARRGPEQSDLGVRGEERALPREALRPRDVVGIEACDERRAHVREARRQRVRESPGSLRVHAQPGIRDGGQDRGRPIRRPVVHDDELELAERLAEHAVDRLAHEHLAVADRHEDRHGRRHRGRRRRIWPTAPRPSPHRAINV
jgi:hypothetical protein